MTPYEIISDLEQRGEYNIIIYPSGLIISKHGKYTTNYWNIIDNELKCIDCKTNYY